MARPCLFCDNTSLTNAHIFRKGWIKELFPDVGSFQHRHQRRGVGGFDNPWTNRHADIQVKCVCQPCNGGWMEQLDKASERLFATRAVSLGTMVRLDRRVDIETVARWCVLIATLFDQTQAKPTLGTATHRALVDGDVPPNVGIWTFRTEPPAGLARGWGDPREWEWDAERTGGLANSYFVTFGVNHLVVQVHIAEGAPEGVELLAKGNAAITRQLWPPPLTPFIWPPPQSVPWDQLDRLSDVFGPPTE